MLGLASLNGSLDTGITHPLQSAAAWCHRFDSLLVCHVNACLQLRVAGQQFTNALGCSLKCFEPRHTHQLLMFPDSIWPSPALFSASTASHAVTSDFLADFRSGLEKDSSISDIQNTWLFLTRTMSNQSSLLLHHTYTGTGRILCIHVLE